MKQLPNLWLWYNNDTNRLIQKYMPAWRIAPSVSGHVQTTEQITKYAADLDAVPQDSEIILLNVDESECAHLSKPNSTQSQRTLAVKLVQTIGGLARSKHPNSGSGNYGVPLVKARLGPDYLTDHAAMQTQIEEIANAPGAEAFSQMNALHVSVYDSYESDENPPDGVPDGQQWMREVQSARVVYGAKLMELLDKKAGRVRPRIFTIHHRYTSTTTIVHKLISYQEVWHEQVLPALEATNGACHIALWGSQTLDYYCYRIAGTRPEEAARNLANITPELVAAGVDPTDREALRQYDKMTSLMSAASLDARVRDWYGYLGTG